VTKATELFMDYLVKTAYQHTQAEGRKILQYKDLCIFSFPLRVFCGIRDLDMTKRSA